MWLESQWDAVSVLAAAHYKIQDRYVMNKNVNAQHCMSSSVLFTFQSAAWFNVRRWVYCLQFQSIPNLAHTSNRPRAFLSKKTQRKKKPLSQLSALVLARRSLDVLNINTYTPCHLSDRSGVPYISVGLINTIMHLYFRSFCWRHAEMDTMRITILLFFAVWWVS